MNPILAIFLLQGADATPPQPAVLTEDMHNWLIVSGAVVAVTLLLGLWFMLAARPKANAIHATISWQQPGTGKKTEAKDGHRSTAVAGIGRGTAMTICRATPRWPRPAGFRPSASVQASAPDAMQESRAITRKSASNLALAFVLLPKAKRDAMSVLYAFCREVDDVADDESVPTPQRREQLALWRDDIRRACQPDGRPQMPVNIELQPRHPPIPAPVRIVR